MKPVPGPPGEGKDRKRAACVNADGAVMEMVHPVGVEDENGEEGNREQQGNNGTGNPAGRTAEAGCQKHPESGEERDAQVFDAGTDQHAGNRIARQFQGVPAGVQGNRQHEARECPGRGDVTPPSPTEPGKDKRAHGGTRKHYDTQQTHVHTSSPCPDTNSRGLAADSEYRRYLIAPLPTKRTSSALRAPHQNIFTPSGQLCNRKPPTFPFGTPGAFHFSTSCLFPAGHSPR